jgi:hypothetical protein
MAAASSNHDNKMHLAPQKFPAASPIAIGFALPVVFSVAALAAPVSGRPARFVRIKQFSAPSWGNVRPTATLPPVETHQPTKGTSTK